MLHSLGFKASCRVCFGVLRRNLSGVIISENELLEKFVLGGGPGGQSVNKTRNRVQLTHLPTGIQVCCQDER
jgi:protein subunit release factor B